MNFELKDSEGCTDLDRSIFLMEDYAARTGLASDNPQKRYLWTDAFAVCNYLGHHGATGNRLYLDRALALVDAVHETLGRFREDDPRCGRLSGLPNEEGREHPTAGGLRIGKELPERMPDEPYDPDLEWKRDGQYFHYLSKWMHALDTAAREMKDPVLARWSRELMETASRSFVYRDRRGGFGMFWKMNTDLTLPLVPSMGQHDPLDGYITSLQLSGTAELLQGDSPEVMEERSRLREWSTVFSVMVRSRPLETTDPLGLGGLLTDITRLYQLILMDGSGDTELLAELLRAAGNGLEHFAGSFTLGREPSQRLAFRELGLSIGLLGVSRVRRNIASGQGMRLVRAGLEKGLAGLGDHETIGRDIVSFWMDPGSRGNRTWIEHRDINSVMLATALAPEGYLVLP